MSKPIVNECEYVYLNRYRVDQVFSSAGTYDIRIKIKCDFLDANKRPVNMGRMPDGVVTISGTDSMMSLEDFTDTYADATMSGIDEYMTWAKQEYAGYTP
jgi:hypothetical protein